MQMEERAPVLYCCLIEYYEGNSTPQITRQPISYLGPKREVPGFDPSWGYDPYWVNGSWVFKKTPKTGKCITVCPKAYIMYGKICGRKIDQLFKEDMKFQTFDNICDLVNADCDGSKGWRIAHKGVCKTWATLYPTKYGEHPSRADNYISDYYHRYPTTTRTRSTRSKRKRQPPFKG